MNNPTPAQKPASKTVRNLVYFFYLTNGMPNAKKIIAAWDNHVVLRCYKRPPISEVDKWCREWMQEELR